MISCNTWMLSLVLCFLTTNSMNWVMIITMSQAVGPVAVTSLLLGTGLKDLISSEVQADPNNPVDPAAQMEYNMAAIQVRNSSKNPAVSFPSMLYDHVS